MATDFLEAFGRAVRQLRQERGMTQAELAARLSLGRTSITNLEKGQQSPPLSMLPEIASALGVDPLRLIASAVRRRRRAPRQAPSRRRSMTRTCAGGQARSSATRWPSQSPDGRSQQARQRRPT